MEERVIKDGSKKQRVWDCYISGMDKDQCHEKTGIRRTYISYLYEDWTYQKYKESVMNNRARLMQIKTIEDELFETIEANLYNKSNRIKDKIDNLSRVYSSYLTNQ